MGGSAVRRALVALCLCLATIPIAFDRARATDGSTLAAVRERGTVRCGVSTGVAGFSMRDKDGVWRGFDVDYCRALAAATLGEADRVEYVPAGTDAGLSALSSGSIDALSRSATIMMSRLTERKLQTVGVMFFDGQGFMTRKSLRIRSPRQMAGRSVCYQTGTTSEGNLLEYFRVQSIAVKPMPAGSFRDLMAAYNAGECEFLSSDSAALASIRVMYVENPDEHVLLRHRISKEPLGPLVRKGDEAWMEIARWTLAVMIEAEEIGVSRANVESLRSSESARVRRVVGRSPGFGAGLGLDDEWAYRVVSQVGNYGDVFEANIGRKTPLMLERGLNELWTKGGLLFALPPR